MIDDSEKRNRQLAFELQNSYVFEKRSYILQFYLSLKVAKLSDNKALWERIFGRGCTTRM